MKFWFYIFYGNWSQQKKVTFVTLNRPSYYSMTSIYCTQLRAAKRVFTQSPYIRAGFRQQKALGYLINKTLVNNDQTHLYAEA